VWSVPPVRSSTLQASTTVPVYDVGAIRARVAALPAVSRVSDPAVLELVFLLDRVDALTADVRRLEAALDAERERSGVGSAGGDGP
jgi:uncharacterized small protein (DUF1192 family)